MMPIFRGAHFWLENDSAKCYNPTLEGAESSVITVEMRHLSGCQHLLLVGAGFQGC